MRKNKFLAALAIAAVLATSAPLSAFAANEGVAATASSVTYGTVTDAEKALLLGEFDAAFYAKTNADVAAAFSTDAALFNHFVTAGIFEGRDMNANFNVSAYKSAYTDLKKEFGEALVPYYIHYINHGKSENRKATVEAVTKAGYDVYSAVDGRLVAKAVVASVPATSSSSDTTPSTVTDSSEIDKLNAKIKELQDTITELTNKLNNAVLTPEEKTEIEDKLTDAEKELADLHNAQGDKSTHAKSEAEKYNPDHVKTATTLAGDIPTTSVAYVPDGAVEVKFNNNVWYNYADGKFYTGAKATDKGKYSGAVLHLKDGYIRIGNEYFETYSLDPYKVLPYIINVNMNDKYDWFNYVNKDGSQRELVGTLTNQGPWTGEADALGTDKGNVLAPDNDRKVTAAGQTAIVPYYVNNSGEKKYMEVTWPTEDKKWADQKGYFNILGEYVTVNPMTFDEKNGLLSDYWVNVDDKYYVVVSEQTTYLDKAGNWNYKKDAYGNQLYIHVGGMAPNFNNNEASIPQGPDVPDPLSATSCAHHKGAELDGFIELNTDKDDHLKVVRSPYLREVQKDEKDAYQYSMRFVSNTNDEAGKADDYDKMIGQWQQDKYYLFTQDGYNSSIDTVTDSSVTPNSVTEGSWGSLQQFYVQDWTRFNSQDEALVAWYIVHYQFGGKDNLRRIVCDWLGDATHKLTNKQIVDGLLAKVGTAEEEQAMKFFKYLHVDEYYEEIGTDEGYILCLADQDGFAVELNGATGLYDRLNGSKLNIPEAALRVRAFQYIPTSQYKDACNQNLVQFHKNAATGKYYVDVDYEGNVWYADGSANMAFSDWYRVGTDGKKDDPRWDDFVALGYYSNWDHRTTDGKTNSDDWDTDKKGEGFNGKNVAQKKWLDETGLVITEDRLAKLKGSVANKHGYLYVRVKIYDYNKTTDTLVIDPASPEGEERWYKAITISPVTRPEDALYDANSDAWYYNKPVRESVATWKEDGKYSADTEGIVEVEVKTLAEAFDLRTIDYPIFTVVQAKENGRFYAVRDYNVVSKETHLH